MYLVLDNHHISQNFSDILISPLILLVFKKWDKVTLNVKFIKSILVQIDIEEFENCFPPKHSDSALGHFD